MTFPGGGAQVYRNEEGEVLGWDYPSYNDDYYEDDFYDALYADDFSDDEEG